MRNFCFSFENNQKYDVKNNCIEKKILTKNEAMEIIEQKKNISIQITTLKTQKRASPCSLSKIIS